MRQLEPNGVGEHRRPKKPIYEEPCPEFQDWVNCYVELNRMHHFKDDPEWGHLLLCFCNGSVTLSDIHTINECIAKPNTQLPADIKYATFFNHDCDSINAALFQK
jgi:hypothetical protein